MHPSLADYQSGCTTWRFTHIGTQYKVTHHSISEFNTQGTWCFYVYFNSKMFQRQEDWALFDVQPVIKEYMAGKFWRHIPYESLPEFSWHGGATFAEIHQHVDKFTGEYYNVLEVGCDYAHLFDRERGYPYNLDIVKVNAMRVIEELHAQFPQNNACGYSGKIDHPSAFYKAKNGVMVHNSMIDNLKESNWNNWLPEENTD